MDLGTLMDTLKNVLCKSVLLTEVKILGSCPWVNY